MLSQVFSFWIGVVSTWISWLFTLKINENPDITIGGFLLAFAFIGCVIYFLVGTDFFPGHINVSVDNVDRDTVGGHYVGRHSSGNAGKDYSTRSSRYK